MTLGQLSDVAYKHGVKIEVELKDAEMTLESIAQNLKVQT